jgi:hypothetical protein
LVVLVLVVLGKAVADRVVGMALGKAVADRVADKAVGNCGTACLLLGNMDNNVGKVHSKVSVMVDKLNKGNAKVVSTRFGRYRLDGNSCKIWKRFS